MRLPSLKFLRTFQIAAKHLSFKEAALELSITASAVSHQIKNLEDFLEVPLFERKTRSLALTEAGQAYFDFLDRMFSQLEDATEQLTTEHRRDVLHLCAPPFFAREAILPRLTEIYSLLPNTDIRMVTQPSAMKVHSSESDISVLLGNGEWPDLTTYRLFGRKVVVAASPGLLAKSKVQNFSDLNGQVLIVHEMRASAWERYAEVTGEHRARPKKVLRFDSMAACVRAAEAGLGFALVSWPLGKSCFDGGSLESAFDEIVDTNESFYLAHRKEDKAKNDVIVVTNWLLKQFARTDEKISTTQ